jgi:RNA polymerase sigma factor (TIGR02999 family)
VKRAEILSVIPKLQGPLFLAGSLSLFIEPGFETKNIIATAPLGVISPEGEISMGELTVLMHRAHDGDVRARDEVFGLLYPDLQRLARTQLTRGGRDGCLDTVAVVNEAYLRLASVHGLKTTDRGHYLAYASRVMRSVIIDFVRARVAERRGGHAEHVRLTTEIGDAAGNDDAQLLRVHEALDELESVDARMVQVVEMKYFAGLSEREISLALGVAERTVRRDWEKARLLLAAALK